jgi:hypothetical protein
MLLLALPLSAQPWTTSGSNIYYSAGNVGIGTNTPATKLSLQGASGQDILDVSSSTGASVLHLTQSGRLGVGNTTPAEKFDIGSTAIDTETDSSNIQFSYAPNPAYNNSITNILSGNQVNQKLLFNLTHDGIKVTPLTIVANGNVGIGTSAPSYKLAVKGTIGAQEVIVTSTGWSDYVFDPGYRAKPLSEVEKYIGENHHLPGIPSAQEVSENGVSLGEMQAKLLAKIEELTLHMIDEEKHNRQVEQENRDLQKRIEALENKSAQRREQ